MAERDGRFVTYSCSVGECGRCSAPPGKTTRVPITLVKVRTSEIAPSCTHSCHQTSP